MRVGRIVRCVLPCSVWSGCEGQVVAVLRPANRLAMCCVQIGHRLTYLPECWLLDIGDESIMLP